MRPCHDVGRWTFWCGIRPWPALSLSSGRSRLHSYRFPIYARIFEQKGTFAPLLSFLIRNGLQRSHRPCARRSRAGQYSHWKIKISKYSSCTILWKTLNYFSVMDVIAKLTNLKYCQCGLLIITLTCLLYQNFQ